MSKSTRNEMLIAVQEAFDAYDEDRMEGAWRRLVTSYKGILKAGGEDHYKTFGTCACSYCTVKALGGDSRP